MVLEVLVELLITEQLVLILHLVLLPLLVVVMVVEVLAVELFQIMAVMAALEVVHPIIHLQDEQELLVKVAMEVRLMEVEVVQVAQELQLLLTEQTTEVLELHHLYLVLQ